MENLRLVHETRLAVGEDSYTVTVYCRTDGRHFAKTSFSEDDIIINDGDTLEEVLDKHERLLPLAVSSRQMRQSLRGVPDQTEGHS